MIQELDAEGWLARLRETPRPGTDNVLVFYEHRMGALCRDPKLMLVPLDDHLVHRGDGVFESLRMAEGRILQLDAHISRLKDSASALSLAPPCPWDDIRAIVLDVARAAGVPDGGLKILLGRGGGGLGVDPRECPQSSLFMVATRSRPLPQDYWDKGLTACRSAVPAKQPYLAQIKSTNYLPNMLMAREAAERGVNVSFSFDENGCLAEAAIANVAVVDNEGRLLLPPFQHSLPGTTALLAMELARAFMPVILTDIHEDIVYEASEILVLGTTPECVAVTHYEGRPIGNGRPGPVARRLRQELHAALLAGGTPFSDVPTRRESLCIPKASWQA